MSRANWSLMSPDELRALKSINHLMNVVELLHKLSKDSHAAGILRGIFKPTKSIVADYASASRVQDMDKDNTSDEEHEKRQEIDKAFVHARDAVIKMTKLMSELSDEPHFDLLESSRDLAHVYLRNDRAPSCEKVLIWVADRLESNTAKLPYGYGLNNLAAIDYLVQAGMSYMMWDEDDWPNISSWLQRASRLTISLTGPQSALSVELEKALATRGKSMFGILHN